MATEERFVVFEPGRHDPGKQSAMNRLKKAAMLGFGPMAKDPPESKKDSSPIVVRRDEARWRAKPPNARLLASREDEGDSVLSFLAPKRPSAKQLLPSALVVQVGSISTHAALRVSAFDSAAGPTSSSESSLGRPLVVPVQLRRAEPEVALDDRSEFQRVRERARQTVQAAEAQGPELEEEDVREAASAMTSPVEPGDDARLDEETRQRRRERRKREEWRKRHKVDLRRQGQRIKENQSGRKSRSRSRSARSSSSSGKRAKRRTRDELAERAKMWRQLNNDGRVYNKQGHVDSGLGQVTDIDLDKRLENINRAAQSEHLMSEEEVMSKLRRGELKGGRDSWAYAERRDREAQREGRMHPRSRSRSRDRGKPRDDASRMLLGVWTPKPGRKS